MQTKRLILLVLLVAAVWTHGAYASFSVGGICYDIISNADLTCEVTYYDVRNNKYKGDVVVPAQISYNGNAYTVKRIGKFAFNKCDALTSVTVPEGIEEFCGYAFSDCSSLTSVNYPASLKKIGVGCFSGCSSLQNFFIPSSQTNVSSSIFSGCKSLQSVVIPASVDTLGSDAFNGCTGLKTIIIEDSEKPLYINEYLFYKAAADSVYIGRNLVYTASLKSYANSDKYPFYGITTPCSVNVSDNVTAIPQSFFMNFKGLEKVYGMHNVTSVGHFAFSDCISLKTLVIPNSVTELGTRIVDECLGLETFVVGNNATNDMWKFYYGCDALRKLYIGNGFKTISKYSYADQALEKVFLFSDKVTEFPSKLKTNVIYVPNPETYKTLLADYNVQPLVSINESTFAYTGRCPQFTFKNNVDSMEVTLDTTSIAKDAGTYSTYIRATFRGLDWETSADIPVTYTITPAPLTIIANSVQRYYGEENPELTAMYVGLKGGDSADSLAVKPTLYTSATKESNAGTYTIYCTGAESGNYNVSMQNGTLTVAKQPQTITWEQDFTGAGVGDMIELTATCSSGLGVKYRSTDASAVLITSQGGKQYAYILKKGVSAITAYQSGDSNHEEAEEVSKLLNVTTVGIEKVALDSIDDAVYYTLDGVMLPGKPQQNGVYIRIKGGLRTKVLVGKGQ